MNSQISPTVAIAATPYAPGVLHAQASPLSMAVTSPQEILMGWLIPIAIILVIVLGALAIARRISWAWCIGAIVGIAIACGAPLMVAWVHAALGV